MGLLKKLFGTSSEKELRAIKPIVDKIEALDGEYSKLTDEQLKAKTPEFKQRIANGESLDDILPEAFAACREAAWRVLGMKPSLVNDVIMPLVGMLIGGIDLGQLDIVLKPAVMNGDEVVTAAVTLGIGTFLTTIIDFILVALVIFLMIKAINRFHKKKEEAPAPEEPKGPTSEELLTEIRDLLKEKNQ